MGDDLVKVDVGDVKIVLNSVDKRAKDLSPAMAVVAEMLVAAVNDEFETSGHGTWQELAASTLAKRRGTTAQILMDTGRAAASIRGAAGVDFAEASSDVDYLRYHVGDAPRTVIPKRDPFEIPETVIDDATDVLVTYIIGDLAS